MLTMRASVELSTAEGEEGVSDDGLFFTHALYRRCDNLRAGASAGNHTQGKDVEGAWIHIESTSKDLGTAVTAVASKGLRNRRRVIVTIILFFLGLMPVDFGHARQTSQVVIESGIEIDRGSAVFWVSPDELLFFAPTDEYVLEGTFRKRVRRITTWNVRTKAITRYEKVDSGLCYDRGNIAYREVDNAQLRFWTTSGHFRGAMIREERGIRYDEMTCSPYDALPSLPLHGQGHAFVRLRPEHGFIDLGPENVTTNERTKLFRPKSAEGIELPFRRREFKPASVKFYVFKGAYFVESSFFDRTLGVETSPWPEGLPRPVWWLYPDGRVDEIVIPYAKWMRGRIVPTKAGLVALDNTFFTITSTPPYDGAYLIDGKEWRRLLRGVFGFTDVSPGGCTLAVQRLPDPGTRQPEHWTVTTVALCEEG